LILEELEEIYASLPSPTLSSFSRNTLYLIFELENFFESMNLGERKLRCKSWEKNEEKVEGAAATTTSTTTTTTTTTAALFILDEAQLNRLTDFVKQWIQLISSANQRGMLLTKTRKKTVPSQTEAPSASLLQQAQLRHWFFSLHPDLQSASDFISSKLIDHSIRMALHDTSPQLRLQALLALPLDPTPAFQDLCLHHLSSHALTTAIHRIRAYASASILPALTALAPPATPSPVLATASDLILNTILSRSTSLLHDLLLANLAPLVENHFNRVKSSSLFLLDFPPSSLLFGDEASRICFLFFFFVRK
jgi:hypothetical protein